MNSQDFPDRPDYLGDEFGGGRRLKDVLHLDFFLLTALLMLAGFGLIVLYSATDGNGAEMRRQLAFVLASLLILIAVAQVDVERLKAWSAWMYIATMLLLLAVMFYGATRNGAQRWLDLPGLPSFQPAEIMKIVLPLTLASYFSRSVIPINFGQVFLALLLIAMPTALIAMQPDLGTALLIAVSGAIVLLLAGIRWKLVFSAVLLALLSTPALWIYYMSDYQKQRVMTLFNPQNDPLGTGWNIMQSQTAIGSGGLWGKGWLNGVQSRLDFLPEGKTDFIVAVLAEEFGLMGILFLFGLYMAIIARGFYIAALAQSTFSSLLAGSIILIFFIYVFVNVGMTSGILPVVGIPLPLVSLGGTSILTLMIGFGLLMSIHTHKRTFVRLPALGT